MPEIPEALAELFLKATAEYHDCATEQSEGGNAISRIDLRSEGISKCFRRKAKHNEGDGDSDLQIFQLFASF